MEFKVLGLSCSPRSAGNTDLLLDELLRGAHEAGLRTEKIRTCQLEIQPCTQCDHCQTTGSCRLEDDMQSLYPKLEATDYLVFASPIYFMAHCAQAKMVIDRCQVFWARRYILKQSLTQPGRPVRRAVFISVGATHGSNVFAGAKLTMKWFLDALEMEYWENLLFTGIDTKGAIRKHPTALQDAYKLGHELALAKLTKNI